MRSDHPSTFTILTKATAVYLRSKASTTERWHSLDNLRAVLVLLCLSFHAAMSFTTFAHRAGWFIQDTHTNPIFDHFVICGLTFLMPLFFFMGGLCGRMLHHRIDSVAFVKNRIKRILVPFLIGVLVLVPLVHAVGVFGRITGMSVGARPNLGRAVAHDFLSGAFLNRYGAAHLWFLYYLMLFYGLAIMGVHSARRCLNARISKRIDGMLRRIVQSAWKPLALAVLTTPTLYLMRFWGYDTPSSLVPEARFLVAYGPFFFFGWLLERQPDLFSYLKCQTWVYLLPALSIVFPIHLLLLRSYAQMNHPHYRVYKLAALFTHDLTTWLMVLGTTGLFIKYMDRRTVKLRYIAEASYWLYLVHLPLVGFLQVMSAQASAPSPVKFLSILIIALPPMLVSYHYGVRYTFIGELLNGKRHRESCRDSMGQANGLVYRWIK